MKVVEITNTKSGSTPTNGVNHTSQHDACSIDIPSSNSRNQPRAQAQLPPQDLLNGMIEFLFPYPTLLLSLCATVAPLSPLPLSVSSTPYYSSFLDLILHLSCNTC